jgi:hypothetical protein
LEQNSDLALATTNTATGVSPNDNRLTSTVLDHLLQAKIRNGGREKRRQKLDEGQTILETPVNGRRLTIGFLCANDVHSLAHLSLLGGSQILLSRDAANAKRAYRKGRKELLGQIDTVRKTTIKARHA